MRALLERGRRVVALVRKRNALSGLESSRLEIVTADLLDVAAYREHFQSASVVYHLAALRVAPGVSSSLLRRVNVEGSVSLASASMEAGVGRFINVSTALVFGPTNGWLANEDSPFTTFARHNVYLATRIEALESLEKLSGAGLPLLTLFPTIVFGPDHPSNPNRLTAQIRRLERSPVVILPGGGGQRRNVVHVGDVVDALLAAESAPLSSRRIIAGGENVSLAGFNDEVLLQIGRKKLRLRVGTSLSRRTAGLLDRLRSFDPAEGYTMRMEMLLSEWCFSSERATELLGYAPRKLSDGIALTLEEIRKVKQRGH